MNELSGTIAMSARHLRDLLDRAHAGEDPGLLMAEEYANSVHGPLREWLDKVDPPGRPA